MNVPSTDSLEPRIEGLLDRFRIPAQDAQEILDEIMLTMLTKRDRIRDPERWMLQTLKNRCLMYWRKRRRRLYRVIDSGLLTVLTSDEVPAEEKGALRGELEDLVEGVEPECRAHLKRRYGLEAQSPRVEPWSAEEEEDKDLRCVGAMARRFSSARPRERLTDLGLFRAAEEVPEGEG